MSNQNDFDIYRGVLRKYTGPGGNVVLPKGVTHIEHMAFRNCDTLTGVILQEGVTSIANNAFSGCTNLRSITLPKSLQRNVAPAIPEWVEVELWVQKWTPEIKEMCKSCHVAVLHVEDITKTPTAYRSAAAIGFICEEIEDLTSPRAEAHMAYLKRNAGKLSEQAVERPEVRRFLLEHKLIKAKDLDVFIEEANKQGNTEAAAALLNYQNELGTEKVRKAREKKEAETEQVFERKLELTKRTREDGIAGLTFVVTGDLWKWESRKEVKEYLESYGAKLGSGITKKTDYLVTRDPDSGSEKNKKAKELGVDVISEDDFNDMVCKHFKDAEEIVVPSWVREITNGAFGDCEQVKKIEIPKHVTVIGWDAFFCCENLESIFLPKGVTEIGRASFYGCGSLTELTIPKGVRYIGDNMFTSCTNLQSVSLPDDVTEIDECAFFCCDALREIALPKNLERLGRSAFYGCESLRSITIPEHVTAIEDTAFRVCRNLQTIFLPEGVTSISQNAFEVCPNLTIHAPAGSYAEQYAKEHNIPFQPTEEK